MSTVFLIILSLLTQFYTRNPHLKGEYRLLCTVGLRLFALKVDMAPLMNKKILLGGNFNVYLRGCIQIK